jgi:hypothetical protein
MSSIDVDTEVFVYTGPGGDDVPQDVVRVRIDPSDTSISIPAYAFNKCTKLAEVELCEGLVEIGRLLRPFNYEDHHPHITPED